MIRQTPQPRKQATLIQQLFPAPQKRNQTGDELGEGTLPSRSKTSCCHDIRLVQNKSSDVIRMPVLESAEQN